ncbi:NAD(P)/FAD-dependent oxidoreductase [Microvirga brassicacearum]|nr:FAD-dependent oxidoreductase [Microvirga brassicacearum]
MSGIVIVGAGHAGSQAAIALRQGGYRDPITLVGQEREIPYHRPPLSKAFLKGAAASPVPLRSSVAYSESAVSFLQGSAAAEIDPAAKIVKLSDERWLPYDKLILATGATPRRLNCPGSDLSGIFTLRSVADAHRIRSRMRDVREIVVVGGGFVGLEAAATFAQLGKSVTVLEIGPRLLGRAVSPIISHHLLSRLTRMGLAVRLDTSAVGFLGSQKGIDAVLTDDGGRIAAQMVLIGIGAEPDCNLARQAGLHCDDGILVNSRLQTSNPDIYAIGDCARFHHWHAERSVRLESVQNATDQARHVAHTILGLEAAYRTVPWFWSDIADMKLQMVGLSHMAERHMLSGTINEGTFSVYHFRGSTLVAIDSVNSPTDHMLGRKMLEAGFSPTPDDVAAGKARSAFKEWGSGEEAALHSETTRS